MRVAIYARFSSDKQTAASITDQVRLCKKRIESEGWTVVDTVDGSPTIRRNVRLIRGPTGARVFGS